MTRLTVACPLAALLLVLAACNNQYGPPTDGQKPSWGQQHYLDNQRYQQTIDQQQNN